MLKNIIIFEALICLSFGCLITNCPRGGKRSDNSLSLENVVRDCPACGPGHQGQCFGPNICCGPNIGCFISTPESHKCRKESLYSRPCVAGFAMCKGNTGRCAANGICCTQEICYVDAACRIGDEIFIDRKIGDVGRSMIDNYQ
ncbi:neurophysin 1-like [Venturia canescens]|uniref:neurophysin 1-like n=1 Tax=Venturia canescens TaxID=32260 RepID=UPI001C9CC267|nr:neurophysin 1-like [Venturia canescens]